MFLIALVTDEAAIQLPHLRNIGTTSAFLVIAPNYSSYYITTLLYFRSAVSTVFPNAFHRLYEERECIPAGSGILSFGGTLSVTLGLYRSFKLQNCESYGKFIE